MRSILMTIPWKRALRWSLLLGGLTLLGVGVYRFEAHEPRWVVMDSAYSPIGEYLRYSADGKSLYTIQSKRKRSDPNPAGNLQIWNLADGKAFDKYPRSGRTVNAQDFSRDGRYYAAMCESHSPSSTGAKQFICLVELNSKSERQIAFSHKLKDSFVEFSPCCHYFVVGGGESVLIYECATGDLIADLSRDELLQRPFFTEDYLILAARDDDDCAQIKLWNLRDRRFAATLANVGHRFHVRGRFLIAEGAEDQSLTAWSLNSHKVTKTWKSQENGRHLIDISGSLALFSGRDDTAEFFEVRDLETGAQRSRNEDVVHDSWKSISPNSAYLAVYENLVEGRGGKLIAVRPTRLRMLDFPSLKERWNVDEVLHPFPFSDFIQDSDWVITVPSGKNELQIRDCATGTVIQTIHLGSGGMEFGKLNVSATNKLILIRDREITRLWDDNIESNTWKRALQWLHLDSDNPGDLTIVHDIESKLDLLRLRDWNVESAELSNDGTTLVTTHIEKDRTRIMRCWDVGATKPMRWPIAIPATLGVMLWGLAKGVARWRKRRAASV